MDNIFNKAKTCVFWDVDGCDIPANGKAIDVSQKIRHVLVEMGYRGNEATIYAYGDTRQMRDRLESSATFRRLKLTEYHGSAHIFASSDVLSCHSPAIVWNHTPAGDKDARLSKLLIDLFCWALDNPGPANLMIILEDISTHREFVAAFHHLRWERYLNQQCYNVILVQPKSAPPDQLLGAVEIILRWESLLAGKISVIGSVPSWKSTTGVGVVGVLFILVLARLCRRSR